MNRQYLQSISIEGFRGINNNSAPLKLNFNVNGITSIFAPNGIGKSSIFDALSYCLNNELKCFKALVTENKDYKTIKNVFHNTDGKIIIEFIDDNSIIQRIDFTITEDGSKNITYPIIAQAESFLQKIFDNHNFLDYNSFIDIVNTSPEDAGKTFLKLIGYEEFSILQDKLTQLHRNLERDYNIKAKKNSIEDANKRITICKDNISQRINDLKITISVNENKRIIKECQNILKSIFPSGIFNKFQEIDVDKLINDINSKNQEFTKINEELIILNQEKERVIDFQNRIKLLTKSKFNKIEKAINYAYRKLPDERDKFLGELYQSAIDTYNKFDSIDKNSCLLCSNKNAKGNVTYLEILNDKIINFNEFKSRFNEFRDSFKLQIETCDLISIENYMISKSIIVRKSFTDFFYSNNIILNNQFASEKYFETIDFYKLKLKDRIHVINSEIIKMQQKIPKELLSTVTKLSNVKTIQHNLHEIEQLELEIKNNNNYIRIAEKWTSYITSIKEAFVTSNNNLIKNIAADISKDAQSFFLDIMQTPEIIPRVDKKDTGQKVNMLLEKFYSLSDKKAVTLLSESYRNALCLSIYFACALKKKSNSGFLILDDITSSFDGGHQRFLLALIKNKISRIHNLKGKQIILLTHDGELEKSLKNYSKENNSKWIHYNLFKQSNLKIDIRKVDLSSISAELVNKANNGENVGNEIRQYFESIMLEIHEQVNIPMTYDLANNRDQRMLQKLIENLRNMLKLYRCNRHLRLFSSLPSDTEFIDLINIEKDISNIVSHFESSSSSSYTPAFIVGVINKIGVFNSKFQYNCICGAGGSSGTTYFIQVTKKKKNCSCSV